MTDITKEPKVECNQSNDNIALAEWIRIETLMYPGGGSGFEYLKSGIGLWN